MVAQKIIREASAAANHVFYRTIIDNALPIVTNWGGKGSDIHHRDIPYHEHEGVRMHLDVYAPDAPGPHPVLVSFHGGGWVLGRRHNLQRAGQFFARRGFVVFNCSYRLGPKFPLPASVQDAFCALRWVRNNATIYGGDPTRIGVWGDSAGGHLSAMAAVGQGAERVQPACNCSPHAEVPVSAAVHYYGVFDFKRFVDLRFPFVKSIATAALGKQYTDDLLHAISPARHVGATQPPPTLLLCGTNDPLLGQTRRYSRVLEQAGGKVTTKIFDGSIHGFLNLWWQPDSREAIQLALEHFTTHLRPAAPQIEIRPETGIRPQLSVKPKPKDS
jgi:acetyl esterase/lipase